MGCSGGLLAPCVGAREGRAYSDAAHAASALARVRSMRETAGRLLRAGVLSAAEHRAALQVRGPGRLGRALALPTPRFRAAVAVGSAPFGLHTAPASLPAAPPHQALDDMALFGTRGSPRPRARRRSDLELLEPSPQELAAALEADWRGRSVESIKHLVGQRAGRHGAARTAACSLLVTGRPGALVLALIRRCAVCGAQSSSCRGRLTQLLGSSDPGQLAVRLAAVDQAAAAARSAFYDARQQQLLASSSASEEDGSVAAGAQDAARKAPSRWNLTVAELRSLPPERLRAMCLERWADSSRDTLRVQVRAGGSGGGCCPAPLPLFRRAPGLIQCEALARCALPGRRLWLARPCGERSRAPTQCDWRRV